MTDVIPTFWSKGDLFRNYNAQAEKGYLRALVDLHAADLARLKGPAFIDFCDREISPFLSGSLQEALRDLFTGKTQVLRIQGLSFGNDDDGLAPKTDKAVLTMAALHSVLGAEPLRNDKNEIRVDTVSPESEVNPKQILGAGPLEYSNDAMAAVRVPDFGTIACVTPDPKAQWQFVNSAHAISALSSADKKALAQPDFWFAEGSVMKKAVETGLYVHKQPDHPSMQLIEDHYRILEGHAVRYSQDSAGKTPAAQAALEALRLVFADKALSLSLQAGDIVLRNNPTTIYGRSACEKFGGNPEDRPHWVRQRASIPPML